VIDEDVQRLDGEFHPGVLGGGGRAAEHLEDRLALALPRDVHLAKGTVHKHLATLRELDYVVQDGDDYRLGLGFLGLGVAARRRLTIYRVGRGPVARPAESTDAVASLMIPEHGAGRSVYRAAADESYALPHYEEDAVSLHATAGGKAILAYLPETARDRIFERRGLPAVTDRSGVGRVVTERRGSGGGGPEPHDPAASPRRVDGPEYRYSRATVFPLSYESRIRPVCRP
jgi:hypothetical protein